MTVEEVVGRLKAHEERIKGRSEIDEKKVLLTQQEWLEKSKKQGEDESRSSKCSNRSNSSNNRGRGRGRGRGYNNHRGVRRGGNSFQHHDGSHGSSGVQDKSKKGSWKQILTQGNLDDEPALLLTACKEAYDVQEDFLNEEKLNRKLRSAGDESSNTNIWYLDNGASNHMTGQKEKFCELNQSIQGFVKFGDGSKVLIEGKGSIMFKCKNGEYRVLKEVYYIPILFSNIIILG
ncbi:uncharacterized protein LOC111907056 [Lactuca sativa]|uniref:uncharacterized protein LOC111907056 n=1 Tax=Lactuca sativa TaxID=4236 RepID=UPI000CD8C7CB|nr:uncharacterized protein LOC111907056 [Lactuca sativa]